MALARGEIWIMKTLQEHIDEYIFDALATRGWNRRRAAEALGVSHSTVRSWVRKRRAGLPPEAWLENPKCKPFIQGLV